MTLLNIITALKSTGSNIKKYLTKDILILVLILTTVIGGYSTLNTCKRLQVSQQENDELAILNTYNIKQRAKLDSLTLVLKKIINERDALIVLKDKKIISQTLNIAKLKESNKQHVFDIKPLTSDSSYKYLQSRIPAIAELRYPFDSSQVKDIHATYIAKDDLDRLNIQLESIVENFKLLSYVQDTQIHDLKRLKTNLSKSNIKKVESRHP